MILTRKEQTVRTLTIWVERCKADLNGFDRQSFFLAIKGAAAVQGVTQHRLTRKCCLEASRPRAYTKGVTFLKSLVSKVVV